MSVLDISPFAREHPQAAEVMEVLFAVFQDENAFRDFAELSGIEHQRIQWSQPLDAVARDVVDRAATSGILRQMFVNLKSRRDTQSPALQERIGVLLEVARGQYESPTPYEILLCGAGFRRPFVDRSGLRDYLRQMLEDDGARVLVVRPARTVLGDNRKYGKTFSWQLISHLKQARGAFQPKIVDLDMWSASNPPSPIDVMRFIADALDLGIEPQVDENATPDTQGKLLTGWLMNRLVDNETNLWLVFDSLDREYVPRSTHQLLSQLAQAAEDNKLGGVRVVLLGYPHSLPADVARFAFSEEVAPLRVADLLDYFSDLATHLELDLEEGVLEDAVSSVTSSLGDRSTFLPSEIVDPLTEIVTAMRA